MVGHEASRNRWPVLAKDLDVLNVYLERTYIRLSS